jgi:hypothetical protein
MSVTVPSLIDELEALAKRHLALADAHADSARHMDARLHREPLDQVNLCDLSDIQKHGAALLATNALQLVAKLRALAVLYRAPRESANDPAPAPALHGAIWLPLQAADSEGGHAD